MLIYYPETEDKNEAVINFNYCDVISRVENNVLIFVPSKNTPVMTLEFKTAERAKQVFSDLMRAITDGKNLFITPTE